MLGYARTPQCAGLCSHAGNALGLARALPLHSHVCVCPNGGQLNVMHRAFACVETLACEPCQPIQNVVAACFCMIAVTINWDNCDYFQDSAIDVPRAL